MSGAGPTDPPTTPPGTPGGSVVINPITGVVLNTAFVVTGQLNGYTTIPTLTKSDDGGAMGPLPGGNSVLLGSFTFTHPAVTTVGNHTLAIGDGQGNSASVTYNIPPLGWTGNPFTSALTDTITGLQPSTSYDFEVTASNTAGTGPASVILTRVTSAPSAVIPGAPQSVQSTALTSTSVSLSWSAPITGSAPFTYSAQVSPHNANIWTTFASSLSVLTATAPNLAAATQYDFQVFATNGVGTGPASVTFTATTNAGGTLVTWDPAKLAAPITLSGGNLIATATGSSVAYSYAIFADTFSTTSLASGKASFEVTLTALTQNVSIGFCDSAYTQGSQGAEAADAIMFFPSTGPNSQAALSVYNNSIQVLVPSGGSTDVAGAVVTFCVDADNRVFWVTSPAMRAAFGANAWNDSATANPATGVGGLALTGLSGAIFILFNTAEGGSILAINAGSSSFSFASGIPSTFPPWGGGSTVIPGAPSNLTAGTPTSTTVPLLWNASATGTQPISYEMEFSLDGVTWSNGGIVSSFSSSNAIVAPLTGTVTTGTWLVNQHQPLTGSPSGLNFMNYNVLLPAQYNPAFTYPVLFVLHPDFAGMNGSAYPADGTGFVNANRYINGGTQSLNSLYNNVAFRTAFPCIIVAPECDQTLGDTDPNGNFGGYADAMPNSGWNERAANALLTTIISTYSVDTGRHYVIGLSLGAIGVLAYLVDNNNQNGPGLKLWTGGGSFTDQLFRPATPNSTVFGRMSTVPLFVVSTTSDNDPTSYDQPAWTSYTGNTNYPALSAYTSGGVAAIRAASTQFYYCSSGAGQPDGPMQINALGGIGTAFFTWMFSQGAGSSVSPNGICTGMSAGQTYQVRVVPSNGAGTGPASNVITVKTVATNVFTNASFVDDFNTLSLYNTRNTAIGGTWQPAEWYNPDGSVIDDGWALNPFNPATPLASPIYSVSGSNLHMQIQNTPGGISGAVGGAPQICGFLSTAPSFSQQYGYFEIKCAVPTLIGTQFDFWLIDGTWPPELDVMQIVTVQSGGNFGVGDVWDVPTQAIIFQFFTYNTNPTLDPTQFHTYGVDWESTTITFYIDRVAVGSCPTPSGYNVPLFPIMSYLCGGDWTGSIVNTAALPTTVLVDYVAVWPSGKRPF